MRANRGLGRKVLGDLAGTGLGEVLAGSGFGVTLVGEVGARSGSGELSVPPELGGSKVFGTIFSVYGVRGLLTLGDSPPSWKSCVEPNQAYLLDRRIVNLP
jgi:hypothetical protein